jgi:23S rRNA pseudouridine955/2504/2580 synthase
MTIDSSHDGQRIDNFLLAVLKGVPKSHIYRLLRKGQIRVNKGRIKPVYRLKSGDIVRIPPLHLPQAREEQRPPAGLCERLEHAVLFEDTELLVLNKPAGIAVHGGSGIPFGVIEILRFLRPDCPDLALVHRLDRNTSGCLLLAKQRTVLLQLHELLRNNGMSKHYTALLMGCWQGGAQAIDINVQKNRQLSGERMVQVDAEGQAARSLFSPQQNFSDCSLVDIRIDTGRMHQIRVHAAHLGHPVAGDDKYGDHDFNRLMRSRGLKRMFLHARRVEFTLPDRGRRFVIEAPMDDALQQVLVTLAAQWSGV